MVDTHYEHEMLRAIQDEDTSEVRELLAIETALANAVSFGDPAVCKAAFLGNQELVQLLVEHGANLNVIDEDRCTPLYNAVMSGDDDLIDYILAQGVKIDEKSEGSSILNRAEERDRQATNECKQKKSASKPGGCYIATACYGSYDHPDVLILRRFRDERLMPSALGRIFIMMYYRISPLIANKLGSIRWLSNAVRKQFLEPLVRTLQRML